MDSFFFQVLFLYAMTVKKLRLISVFFVGNFCFFVACACWAVYSTRVNRYYIMRCSHLFFLERVPSKSQAFTEFQFRVETLAQERLFWLKVQAPALTLPSPPRTLLNKMVERKKARVVSASRSCLMQTYARVLRRHFRRPQLKKVYERQLVSQIGVFTQEDLSAQVLIKNKRKNRRF